MVKRAIILGLLALAIVPATAQASSDATPGKLVLTTKSTESAPTALSPAVDAQGTPCCLTNRTLTISLTRYGVSGGKLWTLWERYSWGSRAGWVFTGNRTCGGSASLTWDYDWCAKGDHWGGLSSWPSGPFHNYIGGRVDGKFTSLFHVPYTNLTEHNYPHISMTVYGDGHHTYSRKCGC